MRLYFFALEHSFSATIDANVFCAVGKLAGLHEMTAMIMMIR
jgi:hypothetical protein